MHAYVSFCGIGRSFGFLKKESLIGESLSHAAYPGIMIGCIFLGLFSFESDETITLFILLGRLSPLLSGCGALNT